MSKVACSWHPLRRGCTMAVASWATLPSIKSDWTSAVENAGLAKSCCYRQCRHSGLRSVHGRPGQAEDRTADQEPHRDLDFRRAACATLSQQAMQPSTPAHASRQQSGLSSENSSESQVWPRPLRVIFAEAALEIIARDRRQRLFIIAVPSSLSQSAERRS